MAKEKKIPSSELIDLLDKIKHEVKLKSNKQYIPNIIEFCESEYYLNLPGRDTHLYPIQRIILKIFYRGQPGNENLKLEEEEIQLLGKYKLNHVIDKYYKKDLFRELVLVLGRRCVSEDTKILLSNGERHSVGELWDQQVDNIDVISLDEGDYNFYESAQSKIIPNGVNPVYEIHLRDGRKIEVTDNHPVLTIEGWKRCDKLSIKDRIAVPSKINTYSDYEMPNHEPKLLGYIIGDGCCSTSNLFFTCANSEILEDFRESLNFLSSDICLKKDIWSTAESKDIQYKITKRTQSVEVYYDDVARRYKSKRKKNDLYLLLEKHGLTGKKADTKFVPQEIFKSNNKTVSLFLQALFSCDGTIYDKWSDRDQKYSTRISYTTVSEILAYDIHHLLLRFGITSRLRKRKIKSNFNTKGIAFEIDIDSSSSIALFMSHVGFVGKNKDLNIAETDNNSGNSIFWSIPKEIWNRVDILKHNNGIQTDRELLGAKSYSKDRIRRCSSPNRSKIKQINKVLKDDHLSRIVNQNVLWMGIKSLKFIGKKRTFDISVLRENRHNFIANDIILHNSGKDFLVSLMALYESMRLLEMPGGSPFRYYKLAEGNPIYILTVATSSDQAKILFTEIKEKMTSSEYFNDKIGAIEADRISLLTPADKQKKKKMDSDILSVAANKVKGSIVIMSGHSNSDSLLGKRYFGLLLDEVASFKTTGGTSSGDRIYSALGPGTADFKRDTGKKDENGQPITVTDSKIISISSPRAEEGMLFKLYNDTINVPSRLSFKLPTWKVNVSLTENSLRQEFKFMSSNEFNMEFGAEFSGTAGEKFIPDRYVDEAMQLGAEIGLSQREHGVPGMIYYAHLDPAATSHNYALVVLHVEERMRVIEKNGRPFKEKIKLFVVDHIKMWEPQGNQSISVFEVDKYIMSLARRFRFAMVSYDNWNSQSSVQALRRNGIPTKITPFRKQYKMSIYDHLEHLLVNHQLALPHKGPHATDLEMELKCLKRIYTPIGFKIQPNPEAQKTTDDACVSPDTTVFRDTGPCDIKDLNIGDKVLTSQARFRTVLAKSEHSPNEDCYEIKPYYGFPLKATGNHPIQSCQKDDDGQTTKFTRLDKLRCSDEVVKSFDTTEISFEIDLKDYIPTPKCKNHHVDFEKSEYGIEKVRSRNPNAKWVNRNIVSNSFFGYFCGLYIAEGNLTDHGLAFSFNIKEKNIHNELNKCCENVFGIAPTSPVMMEGDGCQITLNSTLIKEFMLKLFGHPRAPEKRIPQLIMVAPKIFQSLVLKGMFDGDGCYNAKYIIYTSTSKKLCHQMQHLLLRQNVVSSISVSMRKGKTCEINGRTVNYNSDLYNVSVQDALSYNSLANILEIDHRKTQSKYHKPKYRFVGDSLYSKIRSIKQCELETVVNITVDEDNTFLAESINTHNCDSLAGVCGIAVESVYSGYPTSGIVNMPQVPSQGSNSQWNIGNGSFSDSQWKYMHGKFGI